MTKMWLSAPDRDGFQTVSYSKPKKTPSEMDDIATAPRARTGLPQIDPDSYRCDPMKRYIYDMALYVQVMGRRLSKDPKTSHLSQARRDELARSTWNSDAMPQILRKEGSTATKTLTRSSTQVNRQKGKSAGELRKIERDAETGEFKTKRFSRDFIDLVRSARAQKEMSQGELAKLVQVPVGDIRNLEKGVLLYDGNLKSLLIQKLGLA